MGRSNLTLLQSWPGNGAKRAPLVRTKRLKGLVLHDSWGCPVRTPGGGSGGRGLAGEVWALFSGVGAQEFPMWRQVWQRSPEEFGRKAGLTALCMLRSLQVPTAPTSRPHQEHYSSAPKHQGDLALVLQSPDSSFFSLPELPWGSGRGAEDCMGAGACSGTLHITQMAKGDLDRTDSCLAHLTGQE